MRSLAAALAWQFRRRHRWGLIAIIGYLFVLAMIKLVLFERGQRVELDDERFAFLVIVPIFATFIYFLSVFSFGLSGDLAARQSTLNPTIRDSSGIESTTPRITKLITRITAHGCHASTIVVAGCALLAANVPT